jgi:hypothetical protein
MDPAVLGSAVERDPVGEDGRSGATLERMRLADGSRVVVKRYDPGADLLMRMLGDERGREVELFRRGVLDGLPALVRHPIIDSWYDDAGLGVLVMRDLGDTVLTWRDTVPVPQARVLLDAVVQLHATFSGAPPDGLTPLRDLLGLFAPPRLAEFAGAGLVDLALRGWGLWTEVAPGDVGAQVLALAQDCSPLVDACEQLPATLLHGDLATVNMAFEPDRPGCLTLIDWGMAAAGPAELELGRLLAGCGHLFECDLDTLLELHRTAVGPAYDERATRLGLLAGLVWLGWNKALDIVEHPDPAIRERERANLGWWLHQAGLALEAGVV